MPAPPIEWVAKRNCGRSVGHAFQHFARGRGHFGADAVARQEHDVSGSWGRVQALRALKHGDGGSLVEQPAQRIDAIQQAAARERLDVKRTGA